MAASAKPKEAELDDAELDQLIEEYKKMKDSGELKDLDDDFENHPFFMDHVPTVRHLQKCLELFFITLLLRAGRGL
jgi:hypothetical protein